MSYKKDLLKKYKEEENEWSEKRILYEKNRKNKVSSPFFKPSLSSSSISISSSSSNLNPDVSNLEGKKRSFQKIYEKEKEFNPYLPDPNIQSSSYFKKRKLEDISKTNNEIKRIEEKYLKQRNKKIITKKKRETKQKEKKKKKNILNFLKKKKKKLKKKEKQYNLQ